MGPGDGKLLVSEDKKTRMLKDGTFWYAGLLLILSIPGQREPIMINRNTIKRLSYGLVILTLVLTSCGGDGRGASLDGAASSNKGERAVSSRAPVLMSINISPTNPLGIEPGTHLLFRATGSYSDNSVQDITTMVVWSSSDTVIATVSNARDSKGWVTTVSKGYCSISATFESVSASTIIGVK